MSLRAEASALWTPGAFRITFNGVAPAGPTRLDWLESLSEADAPALLGAAEADPR